MDKKLWASWQKHKPPNLPLIIQISRITAWGGDWGEGESGCKVGWLVGEGCGGGGMWTDRLVCTPHKADWTQREANRMWASYNTSNLSAVLLPVIACTCNTTNYDIGAGGPYVTYRLCTGVWLDQATRQVSALSTATTPVLTLRLFRYSSSLSRDSISTTRWLLNV